MSEFTEIWLILTKTSPHTPCARKSEFSKDSNCWKLSHGPMVRSKNSSYHVTISFLKISWHDELNFRQISRASTFRKNLRRKALFFEKESFCPVIRVNLWNFCKNHEKSTIFWKQGSIWVLQYVKEPYPLRSNQVLGPIELGDWERGFYESSSLVMFSILLHLEGYRLL